MARTLPGTFFYEAWMCPGGLTAACSLTTPGVAREMGDMLLYGDLPSLLESSLSCNPELTSYFAAFRSETLRELTETLHIYIYDGACKVLGPEATILAMRPHTPSSSHEFCPLRRWARAPNPVASRLETWQSSWHP